MRVFIRKLPFLVTAILPLVIAVALISWCAVLSVCVDACAPLCGWISHALNDATAVFTAILAYMVYLQLLWMNRQERVLQKSVEAAEKSANAAVSALTDLERPWIFVEKAHIKRREDKGQPILPNFWWISFVCRNVGRAPAIVEECLVKIQDITTLPEVPDYTDPIHLRCPATVGTGVDFETSIIGRPGEPGIDPSKATRFVVYGRITYKELNGKAHHTGFAVEVSAMMAATIPYFNNAYDYYD